MENTEIPIVSGESGEPTAVVVPIELWREIESERETAYLFKSEAMKDRLLQAAGGGPVCRSRMSLRSLEFDVAAFDDLAWRKRIERRLSASFA
jgi:hypothetical protein